MIPPAWSTLARPALFLALSLLTACAQEMPAPPVAGLTPLEQRLLEAAERAAAAQVMLARLRQAERAAPLPAALPRLVPEALLRPVSLDWTGPLEALAARLAAEAGYGFEVAGRAPVRPVMVALRAEGRPLIALLRDAGLQAGAAATVVVDPDRRGVRLDWTAPAAGREGQGGT